MSHSGLAAPSNAIASKPLSFSRAVRPRVTRSDFLLQSFVIASGYRRCSSEN